MMPISHKLFRSLAIVWALSGITANAQPSDAEEATEDRPRQCMFTRNIDDFHVIDRNHVVLIDRRPGTFLLAEMRPGCWDIAHAPAIALRHPSSQVCAGDTPTLEIMTTLQTIGERCHIVHLQAAPSMEAAISLVQATNADE